MLWLVTGGIGAGLLVGLVVSWFERWIDDGPVEMVISLVTPYAAYLTAEGVHASGVLSVVACGLLMSRRSVAIFSPQVRLQVTGSWQALNFILNGIVFVLIGLQLPYVLAAIHRYSRGTLLLYGGVFSLMLIALRLVWMFPGAEVAYQIRTKLLGQRYNRPPARGVFVVGWTGMRGVLALAAAISLPETLGDGRPFVQRDLIVFLTFSVILVTLVVQGLSLPALIRLLGLAGQSESREEELMARRTMIQAGIAQIEERRNRDGGRFAHDYEDLLHRYQHRLQAANYDGADEAKVEEELRERALITIEGVHAERRALIQLRDDGAIGDEVMRHLERELDLTETRYAG